MPGQAPSSATPFPFPEAPVIQGDSSTYQVELSGGDALLDCRARGHPEPLIRWSKDGVAVVAHGRLQQLQNGSLAIRAVGVSRARGVLARFRCSPGTAERCADAFGSARAPMWGSTSVWRRTMRARQKESSRWLCRVSAAHRCTLLVTVSPLSPSSRP